MAAARAVNRPVSKREFAYNAIRELIMDGTLEAGSRLSLRPLAARLGVSVMPVRDALRALELEGLVESTDHQGTYVATVSREEILEAVSLRMWLEVFAVIKAAEAQDARSIEQARQALAAGEKAVAAGNGRRFTEANRRFHEALEAPAGSLAANMITDLWNRLWQVRQRASLFVLRPDRMAEAQQEHQKILEAVEHGNVKAARAAAELHRDATLRAWQEALSASA